MFASMLYLAARRVDRRVLGGLLFVFAFGWIFSVLSRPRAQVTHGVIVQQRTSVLSDTNSAPSVGLGK